MNWRLGRSMAAIAIGLVSAVVIAGVASGQSKAVGVAATPLTLLQLMRANVEIAADGSYDGHRADFLDGTMFGLDELYLTVGSFSEVAPWLSDYTSERIYYQSIRGPHSTSDWGWQAGLRPNAGAPVWPMDAFRDRFLTAYGAPPPSPSYSAHR